LRIYNRYVASLAVATCLATAVLTFLGQEKIAVYFAVNVVTYLVITLLYVYLNPRARKALSTVGVVFSAGFLVIVALKVVEIMSG